MEEVEAEVIEPFRDNCPDCGVGVGVEHSDGCDVARCLGNGQQRLMCRVFNQLEDSEEECGGDTWSGYLPGVLECEKFGFWSVMVPGRGWVPVPVGTPGAVHDLNRLVTERRWSREDRGWVRREVA